MDRYDPAQAVQWAAHVPLGLLRIVAGLVFLEHGTQKLLRFPAAPNGFTPAMYTLPWVAGVLELVGGGLLVVGLFSRPVAFILAGEMACAYWLVHAPRSFYPILNGGDAAILYCFVFLYISAVGGGALSIDNLIVHRKTYVPEKSPSHF